MRSLGPYEARPRIAIAVSGGADSLALALLTQRWAASLGGSAVALVVDHRLRPDASAEARQVRRWLTAGGIACRILVWRRPTAAADSPSSRRALQARARRARYDLLTAWCRRQGVLHLALAHHAGDQAETVLMRLARGGGLDGLAGMSAILARDGVRLIRPLLQTDPERLRAGLRDRGQAWVEDPSNQDERFERVRWRQLIPEGQILAIASAAMEFGRARQGREGQVAELLAQARMATASGGRQAGGGRVGGSRQLEMPHGPLLAAPPGVALAGLARCVMAVGGGGYPPPRESLESLLTHLAAGGPARTLGGCRIMVRRGRLLLRPEAPRETRSDFGERGRGGGQALVPAGFALQLPN